MDLTKEVCIVESKFTSTARLLKKSFNFHPFSRVLYHGPKHKTFTKNFQYVTSDPIFVIVSTEINYSITHIGKEKFTEVLIEEALSHAIPRYLRAV